MYSPSYCTGTVFVRTQRVHDETARVFVHQHQKIIFGPATPTDRVPLNGLVYGTYRNRVPSNKHGVGVGDNENVIGSRWTRSVWRNEN